MACGGSSTQEKPPVAASGSSETSPAPPASSPTLATAAPVANEGAGRACSGGGISDCETKCAQGDRGACMRAAEAYFEGKNAPQDNPKGLALLEKACHTPSSGHDTNLDNPMSDPAQACLALSSMYSSGNQGITVDLAKSRSALETACQNHDDGGCGMLFDCLVQGGLCEKDVKRALTMSDDICGKIPSDPGCLSLAGLYDRGEGVKKDTKRASEMIRRACKDAPPEVCEGYWRMAGMKPQAARPKGRAGKKK
jgi:TPR repeat protein